MKVKRKIYAAEDEFGFDEPEDIPMRDDEDTSEEEQGSIKDRINDLASNLDDLRDSLEESIFEDPTSIDIDNNIEDHYIAECEQCKGVFISAMVKSDQIVDKISGTCPLCEKDTDQYLKWVVVKTSDVD